MRRASSWTNRIKMAFICWPSVNHFLTGLRQRAYLGLISIHLYRNCNNIYDGATGHFRSSLPWDAICL
jgi:hypothetical protein